MEKCGFVVTCLDRDIGALRNLEESPFRLMTHEIDPQGKETVRINGQKMEMVIDAGS